jgi:hypothetical protein
MVGLSVTVKHAPLGLGKRRIARACGRVVIEQPPHLFQSVVCHCIIGVAPLLLEGPSSPKRRFENFEASRFLCFAMTERLLGSAQGGVRKHVSQFQNVVDDHTDRLGVVLLRCLGQEPSLVFDLALDVGMHVFGTRQALDCVAHLDQGIRSFGHGAIADVGQDHVLERNVGGDVLTLLRSPFLASPPDVGARARGKV